jgi:hypothetical protein
MSASPYPSKFIKLLCFRVLEKCEMDKVLKGVGPVSAPGGGEGAGDLHLGLLGDFVKNHIDNTKLARESLDKKTGWLLTLSGALIPLSINLVIAAGGKTSPWIWLPFVELILINTPFS